METNKFTLGDIVMTQGVNDLFELFELTALLSRHLNCEWGDLSGEDKKLNDAALISNERLFSAYSTPKGKVWIITEHDRSATTILLPSEY